MYSAYKLNKQGDNIQPWCTPFSIWNQSVPCPVLTVASWPAYRFLKRQVRWSSSPISWRIFHSLLWSTQSKALALSINQPSHKAGQGFSVPLCVAVIHPDSKQKLHDLHWWWHWWPHGWLLMPDWQAWYLPGLMQYVLELAIKGLLPLTVLLRSRPEWHWWREICPVHRLVSSMFIFHFLWKERWLEA